jgi:hypothetical protein
VTTASLELRLRRMRSRVLIRAWHYRQLGHANGAWYRLRRVLADSSEAWAVSLQDARQLAAEGYPVEPVGGELAPAKQIVRVPAERVAKAPSARPVPLRLGADLLAAEGLALVPFDPASASRDGSVPPTPKATESP